MNVESYLKALLELKEKCKKNLELWNVYADVRINQQIVKMKREIQYENNGDIRQPILEIKFEDEEFIYFPGGEEIFQ